VPTGIFFVTQGNAEAGIANLSKAIALDQLNPVAYTRLAVALQYAHRYRESIEASIALDFNQNMPTSICGACLSCSPETSTRRASHARQRRPAG
jgi:hypothetical protein